MQIGIELVDERVLYLDTAKLDQKAMPDQSEMSNSLHIKAWTTVLQRVRIDDEGYFFANFPPENGGSYNTR
jgi:hypothetical protein